MGTLYVVGTPIGNLSDISQRALETLAQVDFIAAEDTRVTLKLLNHYEIKKPLVSCHEHSRPEQIQSLVDRLLTGENAALVSDAGMPVISDPGTPLIQACYDAGIAVSAVPGPTAVATALAVSGMACGRFCFEGFLSVNKPSRQRHLEQLKQEQRLMAFYEAPHKLLATLRDLLAVLGERNITLVRELTKIHEQVVHTTLSQAIAMYQQTPPRGEFVLLVEGAKQTAVTFTLEQAVQAAQGYLDEGWSTAKAAKQAAQDCGVPRSQIYAALCKPSE